MCLGLFHKKDYVRNILHEHQIDILTLQETEIQEDTDLKNLQIKGFTLEIETNTKKKRIATYIKNEIPYKRRNDLEQPDLHLMIIDVETKPTTRLISIYRTFNPQDGSTAREHFRKQLRVINETKINSTVLIGDFNLDESKRHQINYSQRLLFQDFEEINGHHQFTQLVTEPTWERQIEGRLKNSTIDHIYTTDETTVVSLTYIQTIFSDHKMILLELSNRPERDEFKLKRRNWRLYSEKTLIEELSRIKWETDIDNVQSMWNSFEQEIATVVDKVAPMTVVRNIINIKIPPSLKKQINRRNYLLKKRKRINQNDEEKQEMKNITKSIRNFYYEERKANVRRKIVPGNNKSLWDAVKIARDIETTPLPPKIKKDGIVYDRNEAPEAFAEFFKQKITNLEKNLKTQDGVYNGTNLINASETNFMTEEKVVECLKELKTKNCEGYDGIPLRIFKEGASILGKPLAVLFNKIYEQKQIPEQWKVAKIIPLHKKGDKEDINNYRPISNLCSISKVFEKLLLKRFEEIEKENNMNLTGEEQHGFKKNRSTITASLILQSLIARELDNNGYAAMASLDLSAAFDLVNLELLLKRMKIMGFPKDLLRLVEIWLRNRYFYVEANGNNSKIIENDVGTIQGSILGPILYALFIRPLYKIEKITTFADDNYAVETGDNKDSVLEELEKKLKRIIKWLKDSGLKVNETKTELCIFHRTDNTQGRIMISDVMIEAKTEMNVLGITFDSKLQWSSQISRAIKGANSSLQAIKLIRKYFTTNEIVQLLTSNFYSKLYFGSEIWHIPTLNFNCKKLLMSASANALKLCNIHYDPYVSYVDLHKLHKRALPNKFCLYRHCLLLYKVFNNEIPRNDWLDLNFKMINTSRQIFFEISNTAGYRVGNNILSNRLSCINKRITLDMLNLKVDSFKIRCKEMFLM